jgi:hypothetical protein
MESELHQMLTFGLFVALHPGVGERLIQMRVLVVWVKVQLLLHTQTSDKTQQHKQPNLSLVKYNRLLVSAQVICFAHKTKPKKKKNVKKNHLL